MLALNSSKKIPKRVPKWCSRCGRKHNRREACELEVVLRTAKSGRQVDRLASPIEES